MLPLDQIDVAAGADLRVIQQWAERMQFRPAIEALEILQGEWSFLRRRVLKSEPCSIFGRQGRQVTSEKWKSHIQSLHGWGVIKLRNKGTIRCMCKYFAVPKNEHSSRSIFDGRRLDLLCNAPPPVNIPDIASILRLVADLGKGHGLYGMTADIRHWFHQIPASESLSSLFGIECGGQSFVFRVLPMGWSFSPWICQGLAWTVIMHGLQQCNLVVVETVCSDSLPQYLRVRRAADGVLVAYVFLYYDNIGLFCTDKAAAGQMRARILQSFSLANIVMKESSPFSAATMHVGRPVFTGATYLGAFIAQKSSLDTGSEVIWKHDPARLIGLCVPSLEGAITPRSFAFVVGKLVWDMTLSIRPLCSLGNILRFLGEVARLAGEHSWDKPAVAVPENVRRLILEAWSAYASNLWRCMDPIEAGYTRLAVDASTTGWGAVIISGKDFIEVLAEHWAPEMRERPIFELEVIAVCRAIAVAIQRSPGFFLVAEDNTAAKHALNRLYSTNQAANAAIMGLRDLLSTHKSAIKVIGIRSEDNVADDPSRGKQVDEERLRKTIEVMKLAERGLVFTFEPQQTENIGHRVRHRDTEAATEEGEQDEVPWVCAWQECVAAEEGGVPME